MQDLLYTYHLFFRLPTISEGTDGFICESSLHWNLSSPLRPLPLNHRRFSNHLHPLHRPLAYNDYVHSTYLHSTPDSIDYATQ